MADQYRPRRTIRLLPAPFRTRSRLNRAQPNLRLRRCVVRLDRPLNWGHRSATVAGRNALEQVVAQNEAVLEVLDIGDVNRNAPVVDDGQLAVGGGLAEPNLEQIG